MKKASSSEAILCHIQDSKWFRVELPNTNYSIQYYSFICTIKWFQVWLSNPQFNINHLFAHFWIVLIMINYYKALYDPYIGPKQALPLRVRVALGIMAMKGYSRFTKDPGIEPHHQIQFTVIPRTIWIWMSYHIYQTLRSRRIWHKVKFLSEV